MAQAPGYMKLIDLADPPLMPTPAAVGLIMGIIAKREYLNLPGAHIGGATSEVLIWQELKIALCLPRIRLKAPEAVACLRDTHSLEPIRRATETIRWRIDNILTYFQHPVTNSMCKRLNAQSQKIKSMACAFRNTAHFKAVIYFHPGGLDLYLLKILMRPIKRGYR